MATRAYQIRLDEEKVLELQREARRIAAKQDKRHEWTDTVRGLIDAHLAENAKTKKAKASSPSDRFMQSVKASLADADTMRAEIDKRPTREAEKSVDGPTRCAIASYFGVPGDECQE